MGRLFGTDGVRGIANTELTCELATAIGRATATALSNGDGRKLRITVGCDTRRSSDMLAAAIMTGLCSSGADACYLGVVATPAVAYLTQALKADAGIMISASHNTSEYNGIKIFSSEGYKLPDELEERIEALIEDGGSFPTPVGAGIGVIDYSYSEQYKKYTEHLRASVPDSMKGLRIAIDCSNGSACRTAPELFASTGAEVHTLFASPDGININDGCGSTHLSALSDYVRSNGLDAGFAFDGDADRCLCVDENGNTVDGDMIMAMCALDMKARGRLAGGSVVGTVMTNLGFSRFCKKNGIDLVTTKVGDRFVLEEMLLGGYNLGGEQSGHVIFREFSTTGDGQLTALTVLSLLAKSGSTLSSLASVMTRFPQVTANIHANSDAKLKLFTDIRAKALISEASSALGETGRLLVRPSGTEPLVRIMAEGENEALIARIVEEVAQGLTGILSR